MLFFLGLIIIPVKSNTTTDSLKTVISRAKGNEKVDAILKLGAHFQSTDYNKSLKYAEDALFLSKKYNYKLGIASAKNNIGYSLTDLGHYQEAVDNYLESIEIFKELGEKNMEAIAYNDIGYIYQSQGLIEKAIDYYIKSLKILEKIEDKESEAACLNNIGLLYHDQNNYEKALEYYKRSLTTKKDLGNEKSIATSLNNIGSLYFSQGQLVEAQDYFFKSLVKRKAVNDKQGIAQSLTNIAAIYRKQKDYTTALEYLKQAEQIQIELHDNIGFTNTLNSIGVIYRLQGDLNNAKDYLIKAYNNAKTIGSPHLIKNSSIALCNLYRELKMHDLAYPLLIEHYRMSDSILNVESTRRITQVGLQYEFEKKLHEKELFQIKENHEHELEMKNQKIISYSFGIGIIALVILVTVIFKSLNDKKKANLQITQQKEEIEEKSYKLSEALENITDSVKYAKRIQQALLQTEEHASEQFPEHFILFKPKDIVSGDFYWSLEKNNIIYIAAADCTGHGVPGALMSMLGISFLNDITSTDKELAPNKILDELRKKIIQELNQKGKDWSSRDGMDISLVKINLDSLELEWAGANNPLWIAQNGILSEIKGDRQAINFSENLQHFTNHSVQLKKDSKLYLFSDGYADQFGGPKGKKFMYKNLKNLICTISENPIQQQKEMLDKAFNEWKGSLEQIDDVCVIGIKI